MIRVFTPGIAWDAVNFSRHQSRVLQNISLLRAVLISKYRFKQARLQEWGRYFAMEWSAALIARGLHQLHHQFRLLAQVNHYTRIVLLRLWQLRTSLCQVRINLFLIHIFILVKYSISICFNLVKSWPKSSQIRCKGPIILWILVKTWPYFHVLSLFSYNLGIVV